MSRRHLRKRHDPETDQQHRRARAAFRELTEELMSAGYSNAAIAHGIHEALQAHVETLERDQARMELVQHTEH